MKILDRYLVRHFLAPFGVAVAIFCVLVSLGRFFDKMTVFVRFEAGWRDIVVYILFGLPFWLNMVLPVATMLAVLFSLGQLQQRGEFTAFRSAGIPSWRLYLPFLVLGLILSLTSLLGGLTFLPKLNFESRKVYRADIKKREVLDYRKDNLVTAGRDRRRFTIGWLDVQAGLMKEVIVDRFDENFGWRETLTAKEAEHRGGRWLFKNGVWRTPDPNAIMGVKEEPFAEKWVPIPERPSDFAVEDKVMDDMTGRELLKRAERLKIRGAPVHEERVAYHMRLALPFANIVVVLLAIPFALRSGVQARTQNFTYAMVLAFLYWGSASFFRSVGEQGRIMPWVAAWMSNAIFLTFAGWKLFRFNG
jgi:lipopolysaccharide export system permease protein